jgi:hypothetical protein
MAIIDDYAAIAVEMRRIQAEKSSETEPADGRREPAPLHPMRATIAGEELYRRLVLRGLR